MASVPKPTAIAPTSPAHVSRPVAPGGRVASVSTSQVDALEAGTNISFDAAASGYHDDGARSGLNDNGDRRQRYTDPGFDRLFTADTQSFATIFEDQNGTRRGRDAETSSRGHGRPVSSIIRTYETNALVISGEQPIRGTEFSFNL